MPKGTHRQLLLRSAALGVCALTLYGAAYVSLGEPFCGGFDGEVIHFRLFRGQAAYYFFAPAVAVEGAFYKGEFYGHIRSGASLPSPVDCLTGKPWHG